MSNKVPELGADVSSLSDEQIISWYSKHPHATVRSLVQRIAYNNAKHALELQERKPDNNPHGLSKSERQLYSHYANAGYAE
jgi:hypothetical protein